MTDVDPHGARTPQDIPDLTLAEFLEQRLAEDEQIARAAGAGEDRPGAGVWTRECGHIGWEGEALPPSHDFCCVVQGDIRIYDEGGHGPEDADHIARHDPARVLRDVAAKRGIVERCAAVLAEFDRRDTWGAWPDFGPKHLAEDVLAHLAEEFADHPDYREEWRP